MSLNELLAYPWSGAATQTLLHFVWQGLAIALGLIAVVELLGLRRPQARYRCSLTALLLMTVCPLVTFAWLAQAQVTGDRGQGTEIAPAAATFGTSVLQPNQWQTADIVAAAQPYVLAAWLAGVAFFACRLLIGLVGVGRLRRQRLPLSRELSDRVEKLGRRLGMRARSMVFLSRRVGEAMAVGLVKPIVLIPAAWATEMPLAMVEAVIAHELAHLQRQDLWVNLLQRVVETLLFYHPAVWWLSRRLRAERELCCDELAVALTGRRLEYVQALESVARLGTRVEPLLAAGIRGERNMQLLERVRNVLGLSAAGQSSRLWPAGLVALLLPLAAWGWSTGLVTPHTAAAVAADDDDEKEGGKEGSREKEDDDDDKPAAKKGDKEADDDDKPAAKKEVRKDGDKPAKEGARDGERKIVRKEGEKPVKEGAKDGEGRKIIRKDGEKPVKIALKDGEKPVKIGVKDGDKPGKGDDGRIAELMIAVKRLTAENERLQAELFKLRGGKKEGSVGEKDALIKRAAGEKEAAIREKEGAGREKEAFIKRAAAEKEEPVARERKIKEGAERSEAEIRERKIKAAEEREGDDKEAAIRRELIEKKKAEAAERERKEGDKK